MTRALVVASACLATLLAAATANATVVLPAGFEQMVEGAQTIVHGRVLEVGARMTPGRRSIESAVVVDVIEVLKGNPGSRVAFRTPDGVVGRYRGVTVGAPVFAAGDEVVLFLRGRAPSMPVVYGLNQGVYRVVRDSRGVVRVTQPIVSGGGRVVRGDPARTALPVDEFSRRVKALAAGAR